MAIASSLIAAAATVGGAALASRGSNRASERQSQSNSEMLAFEREQAALEQQRYEDEQARLDAAWAADQARKAPFRDAALSILGGYGYNIPDNAWQTSQRPEGWGGGATPSPNSVYRDPASARIDESGFDGVQRRTPTARDTIASMMRRA